MLLDYASTKGAIVAFTRSLALSVADRGIRSTPWRPGRSGRPSYRPPSRKRRSTRFGADVTLKRAGQPVEIAHSYVFLASEGGSYMTGQVLHPNGGTIVGGYSEKAPHQKFSGDEHFHFQQLKQRAALAAVFRNGGPNCPQATADPQALHLRAWAGICSRH